MKEYAGELTDEEMATNRWENEGGRMAVAQSGVLFVWKVNAPYLLSGALLVAVALFIGWQAVLQVRRDAVPV